MQIVYTCNAVTCRAGIYARHFHHSVACIGQHDVAQIGGAASPVKSKAQIIPDAVWVTPPKNTPNRYNAHIQIK